MLKRDDAERIADAITALRGTWNRAQLLGVMVDPRIRERRQPRDVAAALAWLALDPNTRQPTRALEAGPWWGTTDPKAIEHNTSASITHPEPDDCDICGLKPWARHDEHDYRPRNQSGRGVGPSEHVRKQLKEAGV